MKLLILVIIAAVCVSDMNAVRLACNSASETAASKYYCLAVDNSTPTACAQCVAGVKYWLEAIFTSTN